MKIHKLSQSSIKRAAKVLKEGGIVCFPTDTIYGLLSLANNKEAVERLYSIRRPSGRPFLLLLPSPLWVKTLGLLAKEEHLLLMKLFNATFIFYKKNSIPLYLTRGRKSLAVRVPPATSEVCKLLNILDNPVVAPSANPEGEKPATTIKEAIEYFGDKIDLYINGGKRQGKASSIVRVIYPHGLRLVREGNIPFENILTTFKGLKITSSFSSEAFPLEFSSLDPFDLPFLPHH
ncbi:MAG: L-threonylcarbamoyladenylate synthase [Aquificaceae bacterium]